MNYNYLITGILAGGILIVAASISIAINARDVEVEKNPYETGLHFDETAKRKAELGWRLRCTGQ